MNIDQNERPEESLEDVEQPTRDMQSIIEGQARVEGIAQQLEQDRENRQAYENITEDGLRQIVEDVLGEADPEVVEEMRQIERIEEAIAEEQPRDVRQIDLSQIPPGMTTEDYVRHYQQTGTLITEATAIASSYEGTTTDGTTIASNGDTWIGTTRSTDAAQPTLLRKPSSMFEAMKEVEEKEPPPPPTPEELAQIRIKRRAYHVAQLAHRRKICVRDLKIGSNDLIIAMSTSYRGFVFYHIDLEGQHLVDSSRVTYSSRRRRLKIDRALSSHFHFDKHMNRLIPNADGRVEDGERKTVRDGRRVYQSQFYRVENRGGTDESNFIIIDKAAFLNSRGRDIRLKRRQMMLYPKVMEIKKGLSRAFDKMDQFLTWMRTHIEEVHLKEDFDIMYNMEGRIEGGNSFGLILKFRDITISNSIEMEHYIGEILVKSEGSHYLYNGDEVRSKMHGSISGARLGFNPADAALNYQHSHLTSNMTNFGGFCTGNESYHNGEGYISPLQLQSHIIKLFSFVQWESLEGGPHMKMENIGVHGVPVNVMPTVMNSNMVGPTYIDRIIREIKQTEQKFTAFSDCFSIINSGENLKFIVDYQMFFEKFMEVFDNDFIKRIHNESGERLYTYNPIGRTFHSVINNEMTDASRIIEKAQQHIVSLAPVYMDGKYIRPHLTTFQADDILQGVRFCPEPNFMKEVAQMILYHLTNKLEEYGNSSENA